jgi:hypothetical protein
MQKVSSRQFMAYGLITVMLLSAVFVSIQQCKPDPSASGAKTAKTTQTPAAIAPKVAVPQLPVPDFNQDSAYRFVERQVKFGPRIPNSDAHKKCGAWLVSEFKRYGLNVIEQPFQAPYYKGGTFNGTNIIAEYNPSASRRICIACHWDSRNEAEADTHDKAKPIDGADDGASGIGIMLEMARILNKNKADIGVDFICFDLEDNGSNSGPETSWCLGSQYWSKNLHRSIYSPYYAILLDMVGAKNPKFPKEGFSYEYAPQAVDRIWNLAKSMGYGDMFVNEVGPKVTDDHRFAIENAQISMIDIIHMPGHGEDLFPKHHHTHDDNMNIIDKTTLKKVGQLMTAFVFQVYNEQS